MEGITLGQIALAVAFLVSLLGGISYLKGHLKEWIGDSMGDRFDRVDKSIEELRDKIEDVDLATCKNFLVSEISYLEKNPLDEIAKERFYEQYEHYLKVGGNSYIKSRVEALQKEGKL